MKHPNTFTIYDASAGSGKTFTLVKEYLLLLFSSSRNDGYKNILAITFTNKAVAEMKSRIIDTLHALSETECPVKYQAVQQMLSKETGSTSEEIKIKAKEILESLLHNYASFEVSTIDGFTHRVLRTFARDLELPLNFEVELNTGEVLQEAVDRVISKAGEDKQLTKVLVDFALTKADDDKSWDIARDLVEIAELHTKEAHQAFLLLLKDKSLQDFENFSARIKKQLQFLKDKIGETTQGFFSLLQDQNLEDSDFSSSYCPKFFKKLEKGDFDVKFDAKWQINISEVPLYPKKTEDYKKEILDKLQPQIVAVFEEAKKYITQLQFHEAIKKKLTPLSLLSVIGAEIENIKQEEAIVLISEFNPIIGKTVKNQPAPFIYERLGERYDHYFIDEFQDTSQLQWENLIPLISYNLEIEHEDGRHGSLGLVGDAKQSIYRWRGGKAEQFMELCSGKHPFQIDKNLVSLPNNYRSAKEIVDFNTSFFNFSAQVFSKSEHRGLYEKTSAQTPINQHGGYVNISFIEAENTEEEMQIYPEAVLKIIQDLEQKNIPKSDICILTRRKKESVAIANYLSEHHIPLISAESLLVSRSPEVVFINLLLQYSINTKDNHVKLQILEFLLEHSIKVEDEFQFISESLLLDGQSFFGSLEHFGFHFELAYITEVSIYEAVEHCIRVFNLIERSNAYVQFYLDFVFECSQKDNSGIFGFLQVWEQKKETLSITVPQGENAVQIMTIHKAKGLEFPVVIYPFANNKIKDVARESLWMQFPEPLSHELPVGYLDASSKMENWGEEAAFLYEELCSNSQLDTINVLYVALTRPAQQLYIISKMDLDNKGAEKMNQVSGWFISYLKAIGKWDGSFSYEFGNANDFISEGKSESNSKEQEHYYSSPTSGKGLSIITKSGTLWDSKQEKAIERGELIHTLFATINTTLDVDLVLQHALKDGLFKKEATQELKNIILKVTGHPELATYYSGTSTNYNERNIISENGSILRPDRINISGEHASIIDYKTGNPLPKHRDQINSYAAVLARMGFTIEKKILVYLHPEVMVSIVP